MPKLETVGFEISISGRDDGTVEAVYIQILDEPVARTKVIEEDTLLADYSKDGRLVGIEVLAPIRISDLEQLVNQTERGPALRRFVETSAPRDLVCG